MPLCDQNKNFGLSSDFSEGGKGPYIFGRRKTRKPINNGGGISTAGGILFPYGMLMRGFLIPERIAPNDIRTP